jgi:argininosuccinate synthase
MRGNPDAHHRTQRDVTGLVRLKRYKDNIIVAGRKSPKSHYDQKIATINGERSRYDQTDTTGFIHLNALRLRLRAAITQAGGSTPAKETG